MGVEYAPTRFIVQYISEVKSDDGMANRHKARQDKARQRVASHGTA